MKHLKHILALILALALLGVPAFAAETSGWAAAEMERAERLGLIPGSELPENYTQPVTRAGFRALAMQYLAVSSRCDGETFRGLLVENRAERNADGTVKRVFTDGSEADSLAWYAGLVLGDGNGLFRPQDTITRQEVAVMVLRAWMLCGGATPETGNVSFSDASEIADWAAEAASALAGWGVLKGHDDGRFDPEGLCTVEQAVALLLRLYDRAPAEPKPIFSAEECSAWLNARLDQNGLTRTHSLTVEGTQATFVREEVTGVMRAESVFYLLYRDGGLVRLDLGVQNTPYGPTAELELREPTFSDDGGSFRCTAVIGEEVTLDGRLLCEKGTYRITVDLQNPCTPAVVKE